MILFKFTRLKTKDQNQRIADQDKQDHHVIVHLRVGQPWFYGDKDGILLDHQSLLCLIITIIIIIITFIITSSSSRTKTGSFSITKNSFACSTFTIDHWKMAADTRFDLWNHSSLITVTASITFSMTTESFDGSRFSSLRLLFTWICLLVSDHQVKKL